MPKEWNTTKKWNPFNSAKLMAHVDRWSQIAEGRTLPPPVLVTIDPTNFCNLKCSWCNAKKVREQPNIISLDMLEALIEFLADWGVKTVCLAGGGESMLHPDIERIMLALVESHIRFGIVTNGTHLLDTASILLADWVGVSVDAASRTTYKQAKGLDRFGDVVHYMRTLIRRAKGRDMPLGKLSLGNGVMWKFLVHPSNVHEMFIAAEHAKEIGCKGIHFRPAGTPWDDLQIGDKITFSRKQIKIFNNHLANAIDNLDDDRFSVYGVRHKFTRELKASHCFRNCHAVFMTAVIMPSIDNERRFNLGLCCDRRGDKRTTVSNLERPEQIRTFWGSSEHWAMQKTIIPNADCPRCTYAPHNEIFENVIQNDSMTHDFI
jgi:MoaA/NifB/PqqE/SkfB family radical SAM enzyme